MRWGTHRSPRLVEQVTPAVSVVIPSFNNVAHVEQTVTSVLAQTFTDFELLISDHGSTDGTWDLLQRFARDPRVQLTRISPGGGAERNWNHVTRLAAGELIKLVCADDLLHAECLEQQVAEFAQTDERVVMVACRRDIVDNTGRAIARARGLRGLEGRVDGRRASRVAIRSGTNAFGEPACVMFRRDPLVRAGLWSGADGYVIDLATYLKVLTMGDLVAQPRSLAAFRVSAGQWSVRLVRDQTRQVSSLRRSTRKEWPGRFTRVDLAVGSVMTHLQAQRRRVVYRLLANRL